MTASWVAAIDDLRDDRSVRAVVVTGEGPAFCSGGDTSWIVSEPDATVDALRTRMVAFYRAWLSIRSLEVPTIAAVNGAAIGAGLCLALACDIRYAARSARLGAPFVRLGMHPGMAATWLLPEAVGLAAARDLLLTGRTVDADEALRLGLVSRVVDDGSFRDEVLGARCRDRGDGTHRQPAHQARTRRRRPRDVRRGAAVGGHGPAHDPGDRGPPRGHPRRAREAGTVVQGTMSVTEGQPRRRAPSRTRRWPVT